MLNLKKLLNLQNLWQVTAITGVLGACFASGATPFIYLLSLVGITFVVGVALKRPSSQLFGSLFCILLGVISWQQGLVANALVNMVMLAPMCLYGYTVWKKGVADNSLERSLSLKQGLLTLGCTLVWALALWFGTSSSSTMPILDSITGATIVAATVIMTLRFKEQWIGWIIVNISQCYIWWLAMMNTSEVTAVFAMKVIFLVNSLIGWWNWNKNKS